MIRTHEEPCGPRRRYGHHITFSTSSRSSRTRTVVGDGLSSFPALTSFSTVKRTGSGDRVDLPVGLPRPFASILLLLLLLLLPTVTRARDTASSSFAIERRRSRMTAGSNFFSPHASRLRRPRPRPTVSGNTLPVLV